MVAYNLMQEEKFQLGQLRETIKRQQQSMARDKFKNKEQDRRLQLPEGWCNLRNKLKKTTNNSVVLEYMVNTAKEGSCFQTSKNIGNADVEDDYWSTVGENLTCKLCNENIEDDLHHIYLVCKKLEDTRRDWISQY
jgi:hypothetical protein